MIFFINGTNYFSLLRYNSLLDNVITLCVEGKNTEDTDENLSNADIFFAKVRSC